MGEFAINKSGQELVVVENKNLILGSSLGRRIDSKLEKLKNDPDGFFNLNEELSCVRLMLEKELRNAYRGVKVPKDENGEIDEKELKNLEVKKDKAKSRSLELIKIIKDIVNVVADIQDKKNRSIPIDVFYKIIQQIGLISRKYVAPDKMEQFGNDVTEVTARFLKF